MQIEESFQLKSVDFTSLESVFNNLIVDNTRIDTLAFPVLSSARIAAFEGFQFLYKVVLIPSLREGIVVVQADSISQLQLPSGNLPNFELRLFVGSDPVFNTFFNNEITHLKRLEVGGSDNFAIEFTELVSIDAMNVFNTSLAVPKLEEGNIRVVLNDNDPFSLPSFKTGKITVENATSFSAPLFTSGRISIQESTLNSFDVPVINDAQIQFDEVNGLNSVSLPSLNEGEFEFNLSSIDSISLPNMSRGAVYILNSSLTSLDISSLTTLTNDNGLTIEGTPTLSDLKLPPFLTIDDPTFTGQTFIDLSFNSFSSNLVNELYSLFVNATPQYTSGTIRLSGNSEPTGQGLTDRQTLIDRGITVN